MALPIVATVEPKPNKEAILPRTLKIPDPIEAIPVKILPTAPMALATKGNASFKNPKIPPSLSLPLFRSLSSSSRALRLVS